MTQCKDIPDRPILEFLRDLPTWGESEPGPDTKDIADVKRTGCPWGEFVNGVPRAMPQGEATPPKLVLAKMRSLIDRGLVDGCACGCRGEFELTGKGRAFLAGEEVKQP